MLLWDSSSRLCISVSMLSLAWSDDHCRPGPGCSMASISAPGGCQQLSRVWPIIVTCPLGGDIFSWPFLTRLTRTDLSGSMGQAPRDGRYYPMRMPDSLARPSGLISRIFYSVSCLFLAGPWPKHDWRRGENRYSEGWLVVFSIRPLFMNHDLSSQGDDPCSSSPLSTTKREWVYLLLAPTPEQAADPAKPSKPGFGAH
jgi:hypothetical protein